MSNLDMLVMTFLTVVPICIGWQFVWDWTPYQIKHKVFGWHYVLYRDSATQFYARVVRTKSELLLMKGGFCKGHYDDVVNDDLTLQGSPHIKLIPMTWSTKQ